MAVLSMGIRYHRPLLDSSQAAEVPSSWHRLLHQIGGSWSPSHYHGKEYLKFCLEEYHLQVWDTESVGLWQWKTIRQQRIQGLLFEVRNQELLLITHPLAGQRTDRGYEPILAQDHRDSAWRGKGHLARGTSNHSIGIPDDSKNTHQRDTVSTSVQEWSSHPSQSWTHKL